MTSWVNACTVDSAQMTEAGATVIRFDLVPEPAFVAEVRRHSQGILVGHFADTEDCDNLTRAVASGPPLLPHLPREEFALAYWSSQLNTLSLFRDPTGTRALYYVHEPGKWVAFASMPEPLLAIPGVREELDAFALPAALIFGADPVPGATVFTRLRRVRAAHRVTFTADAVSHVRYWTLNQRPRRQRDPDVPRQLRALLSDAVARRIGSASNIGAHLSGGIDSSVIAALADDVRPAQTNLRLFSFRGYDERGRLVDAQESDLADTVSTILGSTRSIIDHGQPRNPAAPASGEEVRPLPDMVFRLTREDRLVQLARANRCQVLFTGWGGDEMATYRGDTTLTLLAERRIAHAAEMITSNGGLTRGLKRLLVGPLRDAVFARGYFSAREQADLIEPFRGRLLESGVHALLASTERKKGARSARRDRIDSTALHTAMEVLDWLGQWNGVRVVHPFQDRAVLEFCDRMPAEWIATAGQRRRAIRHAAADLLPAEVLWRHKQPRVVSAPDAARRQRYQATVRAALLRLRASDTWLDDYIDLAMLARTFCVTDGSDMAPETVRARSLALTTLALAHTRRASLVSGRARGTVSG